LTESLTLCQPRIRLFALLAARPLTHLRPGGWMLCLVWFAILIKMYHTLYKSNIWYKKLCFGLQINLVLFVFYGGCFYKTPGGCSNESGPRKFIANFRSRIIWFQNRKVWRLSSWYKWLIVRQELEIEGHIFQNPDFWKQKLEAASARLAYIWIHMCKYARIYMNFTPKQKIDSALRQDSSK